MRVCGPKRASVKGFLGVEHFVPEETISFVNSLVKTQSAADGRLFSFAGKGLIRSILLVIVFISLPLVQEACRTELRFSFPVILPCVPVF